MKSRGPQETRFLIADAMRLLNRNHPPVEFDDLAGIFGLDLDFGPSIGAGNAAFVVVAVTNSLVRERIQTRRR